MNIVGICAYCKCEYEKTDEAQLYCKRTHYTKARQRRKKEEDLKNGVVAGQLANMPNRNKSQLCPTPYKRTYVNQQHAEMFTKGQKLYWCICGALHYTTKGIKKKSKAITATTKKEQ